MARYTKNKVNFEMSDLSVDVLIKLSWKLLNDQTS